MSSESSFSVRNESLGGSKLNSRDDARYSEVQNNPDSENGSSASVSLSVGDSLASDETVAYSSFGVPSETFSRADDKPRSNEADEDASTHDSVEIPAPDNRSTTLAITTQPALLADPVSMAGSGSGEAETIVASEKRGENSAFQQNQPAPPADDGLVVGGMFQQFKIKRFIGGGGMGHVYEAFDVDLERTVAIKVLPRKRAADHTVVLRFLNEAKSSARLNHENIAQVYLFGEPSGIPFIAFEYVEGVNLRDYVRNNGVLELSEAIDYILQTASALSHAASHGVTHRDVKPSNILVTPQKRVKLIDMGLARLLTEKKDEEKDVEGKEDESNEDGKANDELTESGVTLGTFDYISPEQANDPRLADVRSDVYSLGCTFYYILTGSPPFPNGTMLQKLLQHQGNEAPDVRELNSAIPVEIAVVIKKMMKKNPDDRYQTPDLLIKDLLEIVEMLGLNVADRGYIEAPKPEKSTTTIPPKAIPAVVAALFLATIVAVLYVFNSDSELVLPTVEAPPVATSVNQDESSLISSDGVETTVVSGDENSSGSKTPGAASSANSASAASTTSKSGVEFETEGSDALYAASYASTLEKKPAVLADEVRDELKTYLAGSDSVAVEKRVAFGWRAGAISDSGVDASATIGASSLSKSLSFSVNAVESVANEGERAFSISYTSYSLLGATSDSSVKSPDASETLRIVDGRGEDSNTFTSLQAALNAPVRDSRAVVRIELKFNDSMETTPISLVDRNVEIHAAEGFRPTLVFKPSTNSDGGWGRRMFLLDSSTLEIQGVNVDFTVPSQEVVSSEWSVFEGVGASELTINESVVTVCNMTGSAFTAPLHSNVAFFRASDDSSDSLFDSTASTESQKETTNVFNVSLNCVLARGEATLFNIEKAGGRYEAKNSGFNLSGPMVQYAENENSTSDSALRFTLDLERVVAIDRSCLVRVDSEVASDASRLNELVSDEPSNVWAFGSELRYTATRKLPHFEVKAVDSIISLDKQALAQVTSPAVVDLESFENEWSLDELLVLDVASFWRRRSSRADEWKDYAFSPEKFNSERAVLKELNIDAYERLANIPPHLFSIYDFSNWILNPIHTASNLSSASRDVGDSVKKEFVDKLFD